MSRKRTEYQFSLAPRAIAERAWRLIGRRRRKGATRSPARTFDSYWQAPEDVRQRLRSFSAYYRAQLFTAPCRASRRTNSGVQLWSLAIS